MSNVDTTVWVVEWIESRTGDWGRHGLTLCERCGGTGQSDFRYCPWCGRIAIGKTVKTIIKDGSMYE